MGEMWEQIHLTTPILLEKFIEKLKSSLPENVGLLIVQSNTKVILFDCVCDSVHSKSWGRAGEYQMQRTIWTKILWKCGKWN
jgi:hypothetical protein